MLPESWVAEALIAEWLIGANSIAERQIAAHSPAASSAETHWSEWTRLKAESLLRSVSPAQAEPLSPESVREAENSRPQHRLTPRLDCCSMQSFQSIS